MTFDSYSSLVVIGLFLVVIWAKERVKSLQKASGNNGIR